MSISLRVEESGTERLGMVLTVNVDGKICRRVFHDTPRRLNDALHADLVDLMSFNDCEADVSVDVVVFGALPARTVSMRGEGSSRGPCATDKKLSPEASVHACAFADAALPASVPKKRAVGEGRLIGYDASIAFVGIPSDHVELG